MSLTCAAVGRGALLMRCLETLLARGHALAVVVSSDADTRGWAEARGLAAAEDTAALERPSGLDLLVSVQHDELLPESVLGCAATTANLHDAPLPRYAGFHAPVWALLSRETEHGVTWHAMTARADAGDVLVQRTFPLAQDETAFTLSGRCFEAALASFAELLDALEAGSLVPLAQDLSRRTAFPRARRPAAESVVSFSRPAEEIASVARALDFGPNPSPLAAPKLASGDGFLAFRTVRVLGGRSGLAPGTVLSDASGVLRVATGTFDVELSGVVPLGPARPPRPGDVVAEPAPELLERLAAFDLSVAPSEPYFAARLRDLRPAPLPYGAPAAESAARLERVPLHVAAMPAGEGRAVLAAALGAVLARLGGLDEVDLAVAARVPSSLEGLYARALPLRIAVGTRTFAELVAAASSSLEELEKRGTWARDLLARDPTLTPPPLRAGIADEGGVPEGVALAIDARPDGPSLLHDPAALAPDEARLLARQLETLLASAASAPERPLAKQPVSGEEERSLVAAANDTRAPYDARLVDEAILERAAREPARTAVVFRNARLTYAELAARVDRIAAALAARGAGKESLVAVFLPRGLDLVPALLGILRAGAAYVPLDPAYPSERLRRTLEATGAPLVLTSRALAPSLPPHAGEVVLVDEAAEGAAPDPSGRSPEDLAYVLFTSGSTGRPKGVMVTHRNLSNLFAGLDGLMGEEPGVFLALTSIAFDISALELLWTLSRGFTVVVEEEDRLGARAWKPAAPRRLDFSLFYFAAEADGAGAGGRYRLLLEGARFADARGFAAVWTPERHFHAFGGLYPNPSVTGAAVAAATSRVGVRAGSVVLPLHDPIRVAEEWSVVDNLSGGRVGVSFASGWHARDFALAPERYVGRKAEMLRGIETVRRLWRGDAVRARSGDGTELEVRLMPPPVQKELPFWLTAAGNVETFRAAGALGANLLTNLLGQDESELAGKIAAYREARRAAGHEGEGLVTLMLHAFLGQDARQVEETVREPFSRYLATSFDLIRMAPTAFPAFRSPSTNGDAFDPGRLTPEDERALVLHAFERYVKTAGLFGTPRSCRERAESLREIGVDELACLVDFGVPEDAVLSALHPLDELRESCAARAGREPEDFSVPAQIRRWGVTHLQLTPSLARLLLADPASREALRRLSVLLVGGEALPLALGRELAGLVDGRVLDVYGPTETTVWSSASEVARDAALVTLGRPLANTTLHVLDDGLREAPVGAVGELAIGGHGLARGYLGDEETTAARFVAHPELGRVYLTGDLGVRRADGTLVFKGRRDDQVKLAGHRVELGEIEAALASVPGVAAAAAAVSSDGSGAPRLTGYFVRGPKEAASRAARWRDVWDETYRARAGGARPLLAGWTSAVTGRAIPARDMDEWLETTVARIGALLPPSDARVLEVGCGAGLLAVRVAPRTALYDAVDVSEQALALLEERLRSDPIEPLRLALRAADDFSGVEPGSYDLVVLNSVAQYFPDAAYLARVLENAGRALAPGGRIFLGDLKSLPLRPLLALEAELARAPALLEAARVSERAAARAVRDAELWLDPSFTGALAGVVPSLVGATVLRKRGRSSNELTRYRFDAVLACGGARPDSPLARAVRAPEGASAADLARLLQDSPSALVVTDVVDPRWGGVPFAAERAAAGSGTAAELRALVEETRGGVSPEDVLALDLPYDVTIGFAASGAPGRYDALFVRRDGPGGVRESLDVLPLPPARALADCASRPAEAGLEEAILAALQQRLPAALVPSVLVELQALPLTPNGKLDRKALPSREEHTPVPALETAAPPRSALEERIAAVWRSLLGTSALPRDVNFFDLGANSLLMLEASARLASALGREVSLVTLFRFPSVAALASHLSDGGEERSSGALAASRARGVRRRDVRERRTAATSSGGA